MTCTTGLGMQTFSSPSGSGQATICCAALQGALLAVHGQQQPASTPVHLHSIGFAWPCGKMNASGTKPEPCGSCVPIPDLPCLLLQAQQLR